MTLRGFVTIIDVMFFKMGGGRGDEDDISAEKKIQVKSSWIQSQNEYGWRKKGISSQKIEGKKEAICLGRMCVAYFSTFLIFRRLLRLFRRIHEISTFRVFKKEPGFSAFI